MNAIAHEGFDFARWMQELDEESRARLDRFLDLTAEIMSNREAVGGKQGRPASKPLPGR